MRNSIQWFIDNPIAANLLMLAMLVGGWFGAHEIKKEVFPTIKRNFVVVDTRYHGATPSEIEQQIVVKIEEAIGDVSGIFQITSEAREGKGQVTIEVVDGFDVQAVLGEVKARVDAINSFPDAAERPVISQSIARGELLFFSLTGHFSPAEFKKFAYQIRDEMSLLEGISTVRIGSSMKLDEIAIEVSEKNLRRYNLSFDELASAIRNSSMNLSAGTIHSASGNIQIQTRGLAFNAEDFANMVIRSQADGSSLLLSDVAEIHDGFEEVGKDWASDGLPGLEFTVFISEDPNLFAGTRNAKQYLAELAKTLPEGMEVQLSFAMQDIFDSRFELLSGNAISGLILVFMVLMLFLRPQLALWVVSGIVTTFAGAIWLLPSFGVSINMMSMFAFIMILGIVVDDAIIVGESIYTHQQEGIRGNASASVGTKSVFKPVALAVLSTIIFFLPLIDVPSDIRPYTEPIFYVVVLCLIFSVVEALFILPSHLSHMQPERESRIKVLQKLQQLRYRFSDAMERFSQNRYRELLSLSIKNRFSTLATFFIAFAISLALFKGGWIKYSFLPQVPEPYILVNVTMPEGTPFSELQSLGNELEKIAQQLGENAELLKKNKGKPFVLGVKKNIFDNFVFIYFDLSPQDDRELSVAEISEQFSRDIGPLPEAKYVSLNYSAGGNKPEIELNLHISSNSSRDQRAAVAAISAKLAAYPGVSNVRNDLDADRTEVELRLKPHAQTMGIELADVAKQVRQAFLGEEIQRLPRDKEDTRVMLRYSQAERSSLDTLDDMRIRIKPAQSRLDNTDVINPHSDTSITAIPLATLAEIELVPSLTTIRRIDRKRSIKITAKVAGEFNASDIVNDLLERNSLAWKREFTGFSLSVDGNLRSQEKFGERFNINFIKALLLALALFAITFRSVFQPFLILLAVPFGFMGAVFGHLIMNREISMMSFIGFLACAGVVVNDNLVLIDRINQLRHRGMEILDAIVQGCVDRFRAIVLTSLTTFVGLLPILFEQSQQAQFLIPMVISLAFGVVVASSVTLFMVPCCYYIGLNVKAGVYSALRRCLPYLMQLADRGR